MKSISRTLTKAAVATVAAGAVAVASASPAFAQRYYDRYHDDDGISAGEIIAGAVILGGIAAIASSVGRDRYDRYDRYDDRYRDRYDYRDNYRRGSARQAVDRCVRAAEQDAGRYTYGRANVMQIRDVDRKRNGYRVKGSIAVRDGYASRRGSRYRGDRRGYDTGRFTCDIRNGRIVDMNYRGLRGLR